MNLELISLVFVVAAFVGAIILGYSRFLRRHHFAILLTVLGNWLAGALILFFVWEYVTANNPIMMAWAIVSGMAATAGLIGWSLGYLCREFTSRLGSNRRLRMRGKNTAINNYFKDG